VSVETGIGPECRKRHGYSVKGAAEEARAEVNKLVHFIACRQDGIDVARAAERIRELGFAKLADRILDRVVAIRITAFGDVFHVATPFRDDAVCGWRTIPGRRFDRDLKINVVPLASRAALWSLLRVYFKGALATGPRGPFVI
jgi:hypothetical protein